MNDDVRYGSLAPTVKAEWLKALRSGQYAQGLGGLKREVGDEVFEHCCLGVRAELAGVLCPTSDGGAWFAKLDGVSSLRDGLSLVCSPSYYYEHDCNDESDCPNDGRLCRRAALCLAGMNDNGVTFDEIAEWIEAKL